VSVFRGITSEYLSHCRIDAAVGHRWLLFLLRTDSSNWLRQRLCTNRATSVICQENWQMIETARIERPSGERLYQPAMKVLSVSITRHFLEHWVDEALNIPSDGQQDPRHFSRTRMPTAVRVPGRSPEKEFSLPSMLWRTISRNAVLYSLIQRRSPAPSPDASRCDNIRGIEIQSCLLRRAGRRGCVWRKSSSNWHL
jgi:hypothetical protein